MYDYTLMITPGYFVLVPQSVIFCEQLNKFDYEERQPLMNKGVVSL